MVIGDTLPDVVFVHKAFKTAVEAAANDSSMALAAGAATIAYAMLF